MKGLAVDSSITKISIAAKNDDHVVTAAYDIGMKQSETLLPAIEYVLEKAGLTPQDLDYTCICRGPGSFTGLRLGYAAVKAFECAVKKPLYGISTLKANAWAFENLGSVVVSIIDAKKDRFYATAYKNGTELFSEGDYTYEKLAELLNKLEESSFILAGPHSDCQVFCENVAPLLNGKTTKIPGSIPPATDALFAITEKMISNGEAPLAEYDGPVYLRVSEAEENISKTK